MNKICQKGQSIVEFAVIVPGFLMLLLTTIYGGMMIADYLALKHVAVSAARVVDGDGIISDSNKDILERSTTLLICSDLEVGGQKVEPDSDFIYGTATAKIDYTKLPQMINGWFGTDMKAISAPEYKG